MGAKVGDLLIRRCWDMKKTWMLWLTFIASVILGVLAAQVPCWESCPRDYSDDGAKCQDCCDV